MRNGATSGVAERLARELAYPHATSLLAELTAWLAASPRFRRFAEGHREKIRKKLRGANDPEALRDVRAELGVAFALLSDPKIELGFEAYGSGRPGPDFTVRVGVQAFNLEVTRPRRALDDSVLTATVLAKLRQFPPSRANVLLIVTDRPLSEDLDVGAAIRALRTRADAKDEAFFGPRGFATARDFYDRFLRLGAIVILPHGPRGGGAETVAVWENASARIALPRDAFQATRRALSQLGDREVGTTEGPR